MASSFERTMWVFVASVWIAGCSFGRGEGELVGALDVEDCRKQGDYSMNPNFFGAEPVEELLEVRVQRGSGPESVVDGVQVLVLDAADLQQNLLGVPLPVSEHDGPVAITLYLNKTCPPASTRSPVVLPAVSGTIVFDSIYAPEADDTDVEIAAELMDVRFVDPRNDARSAELSGYFRFLFQRGSPAQRFP